MQLNSPERCDKQKGHVRADTHLASEKKIAQDPYFANEPESTYEPEIWRIWGELGYITYQIGQWNSRYLANQLKASINGNVQLFQIGEPYRSLFKPGLSLYADEL